MTTPRPHAELTDEFQPMRRDDMKTSTLLKRTEKYLWDGHGEYPHTSEKTEYICLALLAAAEKDYIYHNSYHCLWLTRLIVDRLGHDTYTYWAIKRGLLPEQYDTEFCPLIQANRLRWLRELQREFKEKGD